MRILKQTQEEIDEIDRQIAAEGGGEEEEEDQMQSFKPENGQNLSEELDKIVEEKIVEKEKDEELKENLIDIFKSVLEEETDEFISIPRGIASVEVVVFCSELDNGKIRVSLRSKGKVEIHEVAMKFGGGGHAFASGVRMRGPIEKAEEKVLSALSDQIKKTLD